MGLGGCGRRPGGVGADTGSVSATHPRSPRNVERLGCRHGRCQPARTRSVFVGVVDNAAGRRLGVGPHHRRSIPYPLTHLDDVVDRRIGQEQEESEADQEPRDEHGLGPSPAFPSASASSRRRSVAALADSEARIFAPSSARVSAADRSRSSSMSGSSPRRPGAAHGVSPCKRANASVSRSRANVPAGAATGTPGRTQRRRRSATAGPGGGTPAGARPPVAAVPNGGPGVRAAARPGPGQRRSAARCSAENTSAVEVAPGSWWPIDRAPR